MTTNTDLVEVLNKLIDLIGIGLKGAIQLVLTIVGGAVGAWLVHRLDVRKLKEEQRLRDLRDRRDALRKILGTMIPDLHVVINRSGQGDASMQARVFAEAQALHREIDHIKTMFVTHEAVYKALTRAGNIMGTFVTTPDGQIPPMALFEPLEEDIETLRTALVSLEESLQK